MSDYSAFHSKILNIHRTELVLYSAVWSLQGWCHVKLLPSRRTFCVNHTTKHISRHFMESRIRRMHSCLAETCHLHFWQTDRDILRATAVTRGWNKYQNKSRHRKHTPNIAWKDVVNQCLEFCTESWPWEENSPTSPHPRHLHSTVARKSKTRLYSLPREPRALLLVVVSFTVK